MFLCMIFHICICCCFCVLEECSCRFHMIFLRFCILTVTCYLFSVVVFCLHVAMVFSYCIVYITCLLLFVLLLLLFTCCSAKERERVNIGLNLKFDKRNKEV